MKINLKTEIMLKKIPAYLLLVLLATSCNSAPEATLQVTNPMNQKRSDAIILISRGEISRWMDIPADQLPVLTDLQGAYIPCQADDSLILRDGQISHVGISIFCTSG